MTICTWTLLEENWDALGGWADNDILGAVSSISPAGQLYLDCRALSASGFAARSKDFGTIGTGDYTAYMRFSGDVWDGVGSEGSMGLRLEIDAQTNKLLVIIANNYTSGGGTDGIWVFDGASYVKVVTKTWDTNFHTIRFDVHNSQTDVDIYVDDEGSPSATDADCSLATTTDGFTQIIGFGTVAGNGEYHIDYIKINAGNCDPTEGVAVGGNPMFFSGGGVTVG
ncbi:MAG TPA: hypothetical protein ENI23_03725, partial [bacterium]|nr:hypothetical protein [bacterium]